jgi:hypothetical protein
MALLSSSGRVRLLHVEVSSGASGDVDAGGMRESWSWRRTYAWQKLCASVGVLSTRNNNNLKVGMNRHRGTPIRQGEPTHLEPRTFIAHRFWDYRHSILRPELRTHDGGLALQDAAWWIVLKNEKFEKSRDGAIEGQESNNIWSFRYSQSGLDSGQMAGCLCCSSSLPHYWCQDLLPTEAGHHKALQSIRAYCPGAFGLTFRSVVISVSPQDRER